MFLGEIPFRRDLSALYLPARKYLAERLAHGEVPSWYPYDALGMPFLANPMFSTFHPTNLLFLGLPFDIAFVAQVLSAPALAMVATYYLGRQLRLSPMAATTAAVAYPLSGYFVAFTEYTYASLAAAAFPLVLAGAIWVRRGRGPVLLAMGVGLMLLAGDGHLTLMAALTAPLLGVRWSRRGARRLAALAVGFGLGAALAAVQLVPALRLLAETHRVGDGAPLDQSKWSLTPLAMLNLAWPSAFEEGSALVPSTYLGLSALLLAGYATQVGGRARWRLWVPAALFIVLALGPATPLWALAMKVIPLWSAMRFPAKTLGPTTMLVALLAGVGAHRAGGTLRRWGRPRLGWLLPLVVTVDLVVANAHLFPTQPNLGDVPPPLAQALKGLGVKVGGYSYDDAVDHSLLSDPVKQILGDQFNPVAWNAVSRHALIPDQGARWGLPTSTSHLPLSLARNTDWERFYGQAWIDGRCGLFGSRYVISTDLQVARDGLSARVVARSEAIGIDVVDYPDALPFAYLASTPIACTRSDCGAIAASPRFLPGVDVALEGADVALPPTVGSPGTVSDIQVEGDVTTLRAHATRPSYLVANQTYAVGVTAEVDGLPAPLWPANGLVRATRVEAGDHLVRFSYRAPGLTLGLLLSLMSILALAVMAWIGSRSRVVSRPTR